MKDKTIITGYGIVGTSGVDVLEMSYPRVSIMPDFGGFLPELYSFKSPEPINSDITAFFPPTRAYHEQWDVNIIQSMGKLYNEMYRYASRRWEINMEDLIVQSIVAKYKGVDYV
ncbi:MAG TPA: hypothetical protein VMW91_07435, partial [Desulfosporosinus sp.]|nr:hypothetical protein [Desulfosporosinus sp.]